MALEFVDIQEEGRLTVVTMKRPQKRNALHQQLWTELRRAALHLADRPPGCVILTGAGEHFCAGMDLSYDNELIQRLQQPILKKDGMRVAEIIRELKNVMDQWGRINCPVIVAIEGSCIGGGLELALACDLRVASTTATFSLPETKYGMVPDVGGIVRLVRLIGESRATDLILTGRSVDADEAWDLGIVNRLSEPGEALAVARGMADEILSAGPQATRQALLVLRRVDGLSDEEAFMAETNAGARAIVSGEVIEGLTAFAEGRKPNW